MLAWAIHLRCVQHRLQCTLVRVAWAMLPTPVHKGLRIKRVSAHRLQSVYTCTESRKFLLQALRK